jgi:hypothetical protein
MGLRILYLTAIPSAFNDEAFGGMELAEQLPGPPAAALACRSKM